jgi:plasmid stabilization system protein ParE
VNYRLEIHPRAERDAQRIFDWLAARSPAGANRWWTAFRDAAARVLAQPNGYGLAPEAEQVEYELRQFLFKTRRGNTYRGLFVVVDVEVRLLRVRGPGQPPVEADELP